MREKEDADRWRSIAHRKTNFPTESQVSQYNYQNRSRQERMGEC